MKLVVGEVNCIKDLAKNSSKSKRNEKGINFSKCVASIDSEASMKVV